VCDFLGRARIDAELMWDCISHPLPTIHQSTTPMNRRTLLHQSTAIAATAAVSSLTKLRAADAAAKKVKVAVVALGRGMCRRF
jgi:hypothetical protein